MGNEPIWKVERQPAWLVAAIKKTITDLPGGYAEAAEWLGVTENALFNRLRVDGDQIFPMGWAMVLQKAAGVSYIADAFSRQTDNGIHIPGAVPETENEEIGLKLAELVGRLGDLVNAYRKLQELFTRIAIDKHIQQKLEHPHHQLVATYQSLNRKYSELLEEYKTLRRCFSVSALVPYTDVWTHKPVQFYPGKHPCEKPADMLKQIISASSRPGDIVADFFMGSGSTVKAAIELGRRAIGVELEADRFIQTTEEVEKLSKT
ncbi:YmfL family putative regulatory protein [Citrobacter freundii]|uniref:YmfL family putative regulatory protein n=1 Tax=Citrobacter freundii TaxID=546 RepID=UPI003A977E43